MPIFEQGQRRLHYVEKGEGDPLLLIALGGMRSSIAAWDRLPFRMIDTFAANHRVIAMDQRNAGESWAPVTASDGWQTYADDQLALMDHLGIDRFKVLGMCIGGPYIAQLIKTAPARIAAGVMFQPVGLEDNRDAFFELFDGWRQDIEAAHPEADEAAWQGFRHNMWGGDDFMFAASRDEVAAMKTPLLVLLGNDVYHPSSTSRAIVELAEDARLIEAWKDEAGEAALAEVHAFLAEHAI